MDEDLITSPAQRVIDRWCCQIPTHPHPGPHGGIVGQTIDRCITLVARVNNGDLLLLVVLDTFVNPGNESLVILLEHYHLSFILVLDSSNNIAGLYLENNYCGELREFPFEIKVCDREESNEKN